MTKSAPHSPSSPNTPRDARKWRFQGANSAYKSLPPYSHLYSSRLCSSNLPNSFLLQGLCCSHCQALVFYNYLHGWLLFTLQVSGQCHLLRLTDPTKETLPPHTYRSVLTFFIALPSFFVALPITFDTYYLFLVCLPLPGFALKEGRDRVCLVFCVLGAYNSAWHRVEAL